jgi:hypothetical protein
LPLDTIENIYSEFRSTYVDDPESKINFFERNAIFLNNIKQFSSKNELGLYIQIIGSYTDALNRKGHYNVAIDLIDKYQVFIDAEIKRLNAEDVKDAWYYSIYFVKGMASYNLKDYKTATPIFKKLVQIDDKNDSYKNWLNYSQAWQRQWWLRIISIALVALFLSGLYLKKYIPFAIGMTINIIAFIGVLGISIYEHYVRRSFRKKK